MNARGTTGSHGPRGAWSARVSKEPVACVVGDLSMVRALGLAKIPVALATSEAHPIDALSRFCRSTVRTPSFVDAPHEAVLALVEWARTQPTPPVIFYQGDHDLLALSRDRELISSVARIVLPPASLVEALVDKLRFAELATRCGLPVPPTRILERGTNLASELRSWSHFPCVLKPAMRTHWIGSRVEKEGEGKAIRVEDRTALERLLPLLAEHETDFVVQAAVEGEEDRIVSYHAYVRPGGAVLAEFTGRKLRTYPRRYGYSTYLEITDDHELIAVGRSVVERLDFSGVLKIDFKRDVRDGRLYLLEINPRFSLWLHPGAVAGVGIPELVYRDAIEPGSASPAGRVRRGVRWILAREDLRGLREREAEGGRALPGWLLETMSADINEDLTLVDPLPGLATLAGIVRRRLARLAHGTHGVAVAK